MTPLNQHTTCRPVFDVRWHTATFTAGCGALGACLALLSAGCADFGYNRVQLGVEQRVYQQAFPAERMRRTPAGFCYLEKDAFGRTDAVVVLLTADRRVAGKLHATYVERKGPFQAETTYALRGALDPELMRLSGTGPIDVLRAVAADLTSTQGDTFVREAHGWVAAGLMRLVQHWPHVGDEGPAFTRLTDVLDRIPAGGAAHLTVDARGVYIVEYTQSVTH
jgi:hypothetical protein